VEYDGRNEYLGCDWTVVVEKDCDWLIVAEYDGRNEYLGCDWMVVVENDCDWSIVAEYDGGNEYLAEGVEDMPMVTRKRSNTLPGTFTVTDDLTTHDDSSTDDGL